MAGAKIMVVEDEGIVAEDIRQGLQKLGYVVAAIASSGEEAVQKAAETGPDLVLMDIRLRGQLDGVQAATHLHSQLDTPVIFLTAYADDHTLERAQLAEPFGYLLKPLDEVELHTAIETALHKHGMERRLRESERWLATTLRSIGDAVIATDEQGRVKFMNPVGEALTGWTEEEARGRDLTEVFAIVNADTHNPTENPALRAMHHGAVVGLANHTLLVSKDRHEIPIDDSAAPIRADNGSIAGSVLVFRDISERNRAEEAVRASQQAEQRLNEMQSAVLNALPAQLALLDRSGTILAVNQAWTHFRADAAFHGADFAVGLNYLEACASGTAVDSDAATARQGILAVIAGSRPGFVHEYPCHVHDETLWFRLLVAPWRSGGYEGAVVMFVDVSERKRLEDELRQAQKMEAIGRLAGGVAHDFNNLLTAILGYSEFGLAGLVANDPQRHNLEEIHKAADRAASLTRQLLAFSRKQMLVPKIVDLNTVVNDSHKMLRRLIGEDIELSMQLAPARTPVMADPGQLVQVILNLAVNARDAMPQGGKLTLQTANVELDESYARVHLEVRPGPYVLLAVSDTGSGMDADIRSHLFEPFFTTKEQGKGTGLGLSTVYGIVRQSGGHITVATEPGHGTVFRIYLPRLADAAALEQVAKPCPPSAGSELILVVEDEGMVRSLVRIVLQRAGYTVLEAADAGEALRLAEQHTTPIDLLLTDVVMPGMNGRDLAQRLRQRHPELKVLYMSGHTDSVRVRQGVSEGEMPFLQKPFRPAGLTQKVREVLEQKVKA